MVLSNTVVPNKTSVCPRSMYVCEYPVRNTTTQRFQAHFFTMEISCSQRVALIHSPHTGLYLRAVYAPLPSFKRHFRGQVSILTSLSLIHLRHILYKSYKSMLSCNKPNGPVKQLLWLVETVITSEQQREKEGFLFLLKEAFHYTVTSFIQFRKCAYFTHKASSQQLHSHSSEMCSAFLEIPPPSSLFSILLG